MLSGFDFLPGTSRAPFELTIVSRKRFTEAGEWIPPPAGDPGMLELPLPPPWLCSTSLSVLELSPLLLSAFFLARNLPFFPSSLALGVGNEVDVDLSREAAFGVTAGEEDGGWRRLLDEGLWGLSLSPGVGEGVMARVGGLALGFVFDEGGVLASSFPLACLCRAGWFGVAQLAPSFLGSPGGQRDRCFAIW